jgi:predicted RNA-binding Zn-ribbon protein involved in translation (DUF1610 family)
MSSSLRSAQPIKKRRLSPPAAGWKCPSCGQKKLIRVNKSCRLEDGVVVPKLDRLQCQACGEDFFDLFAMDQIAAFRRTMKQKKVGALPVAA